jgi:hypothetical protein
MLPELDTTREMGCTTAVTILDMMLHYDGYD